MTAHIKERIARKLDTLNEERLYQVLDYVEFLESRYAARQTPEPNVLQKFTEGIEDRLRAGRVSASTIAETMGLLNRAVGVLNGVAAAGKSVATDLAAAAQRVGTAVTDAATSATTPPPGAPTPPPPPTTGTSTTPSVATGGGAPGTGAAPAGGTGSTAAPGSPATATPPPSTPGEPTA